MPSDPDESGKASLPISSCVSRSQENVRGLSGMLAMSVLSHRASPLLRILLSSVPRFKLSLLRNLPMLFPRITAIFSFLSLRIFSSSSRSACSLRLRKSSIHSVGPSPVLQGSTHSLDLAQLCMPILGEISWIGRRERLRFECAWYTWFWSGMLEMLSLIHI